MQRNPELDAYEAAGFIWPGAMDILPRHARTDKDGFVAEYLGLDEAKVRLAMDALDGTQPTLATQPNAGILALLTTYVDPKLIEALFGPVKAADIYGEEKKGDWTTETAAFTLIESTGEVASYGDYSENGMSSANVNFPQRQSYYYQTITEWGERETDRMGLARIDWVSRKNISSANTLLRFQNLTYFFGVSGLACYGGLNDPSLSAALTPSTKVAGGTSWQNALPTEILADVQAGVYALQQQTGGNIDRDARMTLAISPDTDIWIANTNSFGLTAAEMIRKAFPNMTIKTAPQYLSGSTYSYQLIVEEWPDGQATMRAAFNEKMRAHPVITALSSFRQKKSQGTWGTIIYRPTGVVTMSGI